jgi:hypothetical protein
MVYAERASPAAPDRLAPAALPNGWQKSRTTTKLNVVLICTMRMAQSARNCDVAVLSLVLDDLRDRQP